MAEQIPFNIVADVLTKLGSSAIQQIASAFGVAKELTKLTKKLDTINGVLVDAEKRQEESDAVKAWVRKLKDVVYDADDLLDDFETLQQQKRGGVASQVSDFFSSSNQLVFRFKMSKRIKDIKEEIDEIVKEIHMLSLIQGNVPHKETAESSSWRETHSFVLTSQIVGREDNTEEIIKSLVLSSSVNKEILSIVAIVGIGGLGKTTLAQLVFNDPRVVQYFELKIWVCVSDPFEVKSLVKKILKEVCDQDVEWLELNGLKNLLHEKISDKRCLFVLDDVWNENYEKWDQLKSLLMVVGKGSKILVTTRHSNVALVMGIDSPFVLEGLKDTQAWDLFAKIAFTEELGKVHPNVIEIGKEIVDMCNGVPLIIKTLGTLLRFKPEESYWLSIKNNDNLLSLRDGSHDVLSVMKLSYDNLSLPLKLCFAYCALFPKDYKIEKKLLVQMWMAQGYVQPLDEMIGYRYFDELLSRSLLEVSEKDAYNNIICKMHDLIHDLALSVIGSEILILDDDVKHISKEVHHLSLYNPVGLELNALKVKYLRTFLNIPIQYEYGDVSIKSFSSFKCLRVLSLYKFNLWKVPKSLGKLNHLRYLDLSYNLFKVLPNSVTSLKKLQTIKLVGCADLKELPKDIGELINLRHLENNGCWDLSHMPRGIGELSMLQSLPLFVVGNVGNRRGIGRLSNLKGLNNLRGELQIEGLEKVREGVAVESCREANLGGKQHIQSLTLVWLRQLQGDQSGEDAESVLEGLQPHSNLKQLAVEGYGGGRFPSWMMNMNGGLSRMLPNLTTIDLRRCSRCQTLPCFVRLPHLRSLKLDHLGMVEYMVEEEECTSLEGSFFPSLQELCLSRIPRLKKLWRRCRCLPTPPVPPPLFPFLSQLKIEYCDDLASLEMHSSPCLSELKITNCPNLASLRLPPSPLLSYVEIKSCGNLASLELHSSPLLSELWIYRFPSLTSLSLPPSPFLSELDIWYCDELASLELHSSPLLSKLRILECAKLTSLPLPLSPLLSYVDIKSCGNLASLELHSSPSLSSLIIWNCPKLASLLLPSSPLLSNVEIKSCGNMASLELYSSPSLSDLEISYCHMLTSLLLPPSPSLSRLEIEFCPSLASLELHLSPLLSWLRIWKCHELTSLQVSSLPCLKTLQLANVREEVLRQLMLSTTASPLESLRISNISDLKSVPEELNQHVNTLQTLEIEECSHLATLPHWIGNLTSLTNLVVGSCPLLTSLPEGMRSLTSLKHLDIFHCPYLSERCQREKGEDWPKIAHVPYINFLGGSV